MIGPTFRTANFGNNVKFAVLTTSSSGDALIATPTGSNKIKVLGGQINANGTTNVKFQSGSGGTQLSMLYYLLANTGGVIPGSLIEAFETAAGVALYLNNSQAIAVSLNIAYLDEP